MAKGDKLSTESYKGVRDFYPEDQFVQRYIFEHMERVCELFGYEEYNASILESAELYRSKTSEEIVNDQTYTFTDRGEREVTLRPEMTPTVARMIAAKSREIPMPARWYSVQNFFRYERPQHGRVREFWQLNADIIGTSSIAADAEVIAMAHALLKSFGAEERDFEIRVSDRRILDTIYDSVGIDAGKRAEITRLLDRRAKSDDFKSELAKAVGDDKVADELIDHIYGRIDLLKDKARPHMFVNEMKLYVDYLKDEMRRTKLRLVNHSPAYFETFRANLIEGVTFYRTRIKDRLRHGREAFDSGLQALVDELESLNFSAALPTPA